MFAIFVAAAIKFFSWGKSKNTHPNPNQYDGLQNGQLQCTESHNHTYDCDDDDGNHGGDYSDDDVE